MGAADEPESPHKGQRGLRRLFNAFFYSLSGLRLAFDHESAFRQEVLLALDLTLRSGRKSSWPSSLFR